MDLNYGPDKAMRKLFGFDGSVILQENRDDGFEILNSVAEFFNLQFRAIHVVGSAHTGYSYFKGRDFVAKQSDLDLAIIDAELFRQYCEHAFVATKGYTDLTGFSSDNYPSFKEYLVRGIFRPDLMPGCAHKQRWFTFFNRLSGPYHSLFDNINCGIYLSDQFFETKQAPLFSEFKKAQP
ncbi:MAG: hypothetical protein EOP24_45500 [Hyphomicrobiales bacterium]|nr:MAG: hypothetical protein EOP24_45500 [Hyphomicrobiales bacterium]